MNLQEKMEIAQALVELGVDVIEAGFPIASEGDFRAVNEIAKRVEVGEPKIVPALSIASAPPLVPVRPLLPMTVALPVSGLIE